MTTLEIFASLGNFNNDEEYQRYTAPISSPLPRFPPTMKTALKSNTERRMQND